MSTLRNRINAFIILVDTMLLYYQTFLTASILLIIPYIEQRPKSTKAWWLPSNFSHRSETFRTIKLIPLVNLLEWQLFSISSLHFWAKRQSDEYQKVLIFIALPHCSGTWAQRSDDYIFWSSFTIRCFPLTTAWVLCKIIDAKLSDFFWFVNFWDKKWQKMRPQNFYQKIMGKTNKCNVISIKMKF